MSGVEAAGVLLGVFPLVVSAIEKYNVAIGAANNPSSRRQLHLQVHVQHTILKNTTYQLLDGIGYDRAREALQDLSSALWQDPEIESALKNALGQAYNAFLGLFQRMIPLLRNLMNEIDKINGGNSTVGKRLLFSTKSALLQRQLSEIQEINEDLSRLVESVVKLGETDPLFSRRKKARTHTRQELESLATIRRKARKLHGIFLEMANANGFTICSLIFAARFGSSLEGSTLPLLLKCLTTSVPPEFIISSWRKANITLSGDADKEFIDEKVKDQEGRSQRQSSQTKVQFALPPSHPDESLQSSEDLLSSVSHGFDTQHPYVWTKNVEEFGRSLSRPRYSSDKEETICLNMPITQATLYATMENSDVDSSRIMTLRDLIKTRKITIKARFALSATLSRAALILHGTGLLHEELKSEHVLFLADSGEIRLENMLLRLVNIPLLGDVKEYDSSPRLFQDEMIVKLGILLVEILLQREISDLATPEDRGLPNPLLGGYATARRALNLVSLECGSVVADVVSHCLHFDSRRVTDVDGAFLETIVRPLEEALHLFREKDDPISAKMVLVRDWGGCVHPSVLPSENFPKLHEILPGGLKDPSQFPIIEKYATDIGAACRRVPWLDEAIQNEVHDVGNVMRKVIQQLASVSWNSPNFNEVQNLVQECLDRLSTIPQIYQSQSRPANGELENLRLQLRVTTLKLSTLLDLPQRNPPSPALSETTYMTDYESDYESESDTYATTQTSGTLSDDMERQAIDSRAVAEKIISSLLSQDTLRALEQAGSSVLADPALRSTLRQMLEGYCEELGVIRQAQSSFRNLYQRAETLVPKEVNFIVEQVIMDCSMTVDMTALPQSVRKSQKQSLYEPDDPSSAQPKVPQLLPTPADSRTLPTATQNLPGKTGDLVDDNRDLATSQSQKEEELIPIFIVNDFLLGSKAFGRLRLRLRRLLRQDVMGIIHDEVLRNLPFSSQEICNARLHIEWDLPRYIAEELDGSCDIRRVFTLTGGNTDAYASACDEYLHRFWVNSNYDICSHIQHYLEHGVYEHPDATLTISTSPDSSTGITVAVIGAKQSIIDVAQQLAWLTAALRYSSTGPLLSGVSFFATKGAEFFVETDSLTDVEQRTGTCWHRMVGNTPIANGFPIPPRASQIGLELPLAMMLTLSRVTYSLTVNDHLALCGFSSLIYPTKLFKADKLGENSEQSIQWHFKASTDSSKYLDASKFLKNSVWNSVNVDEDSLVTSRHFVGYCRTTEIHLATASCDFSCIQKSALPQASSRLRVKVKSINAGTGGLGIFGVNVTSEFVYGKTTTNKVKLNNYDDIIETTKSMSAILWDCGVQCGWLVPMHVIFLHMAHMYVARQPELETPRIRLANAGATFLNDVDDIFQEDGSTILRRISGEADKTFQLKDLIQRIWDDIDGCMTARRLAYSEETGAIGYEPDSISGWELLEFVKRPPFDFTMKQDTFGPPGCGWEELAAEKDMLVLVCQNAGAVIKPAVPKGLCADWRTPPKNKRYLVASLASLKGISQDYGGFQTPYTRLSEKLIWRPPATEALLEEACQHGPGRLCKKKLQQLEAISGNEAGLPLSLPVSGAVVFGRAKLQKPQGEVQAQQQQAVVNGPITAAPPAALQGEVGGKRKWIKRVSKRLFRLRDPCR